MTSLTSSCFAFATALTFSVGRGVDVDRVRGLGADGDLVHVERGAGIEHRPALGDRDHGDRVRLAERRQPRPLERVDGDVDLRAAAVADLLAVEEHRRLVLLAFADHDDAVHPNRVEHEPHRVDRRRVGLLLLAPPDPAGGRERRGLGDADQLEREISIRGGHCAANPMRAPIRSSRLHPVGRLDADEVEAPCEHRLRRRDEAEPERLRHRAEHLVLVVEAVEVVGEPDRVVRERVRGAPGGGFRHHLRETRRAA